MKTEIPGAQRDEELPSAAEDESPEQLQERLKEVIKVGVADAGVLRKCVTVTVPRAWVDEELEKEYKELVQQAIVPGFRRGRAPRRLVEKRFGGEVDQQVQTRVFSNAYLAAVEKQSLKVLGDPLVWVKLPDKGDGAGGDGASERLVDMTRAMRHLKLPAEGDFEFKCEVEVKPEFELPNLEGVSIERPVLSITDEDVDVQIMRIRAMRGHWAPVLEGAVQADDLLICDLVVTVGGKEVKRAENIQVAARPQRVEGVLLEDFGKTLIGAKVGQSKSFKGELPGDYEVEDLRGKTAALEFKLNDIKRMELPPLDKDYLSSQGFDSESEFRDYVRQQMQGRLDQEINRGMREQVRKYLLDNTKLDLPEGISQRQSERALFRKAVDLQQQGVPAGEIEKHLDELRTIAREESVAELKLHFIFEDIAERFEMEVTEEEINAAIGDMARAYNRRFDRMRDDLARNNGIETLYLKIRDDKCIDKILETAKLTDAKPDLGKRAAAKPEKAASTGKEKSSAAATTEKPAEEKPKAEKKPAASAKSAGKKEAPKGKSK